MLSPFDENQADIIEVFMSPHPCFLTVSLVYTFLFPVIFH